MKITAVETIYISRGVTVNWGPIQWLWVRLHTDTGLAGLGETYPAPETEAAVVQKRLAPVLLGRDPTQIDRLWADMYQAVAFAGWAGAEMRAVSACDIALWDLAGKAAGLPVYQLLGGASRDAIRTYNTCYDYFDFCEQPVELARDLTKQGIHAMKIWPYDEIGKQTRGQYITAEQVKEGAEPLRRIREEFGRSVEVAMEFHGYWNLPSAIRIAREMEPLEPMWLEEMLPHDNAAAYAELARATRLPLCVSERLMTRWGFRELLANGAAQIVMPDIAWCGGISEARKIATAAEMHYRPVAPHNCGGPVLHAASLHLAANLTNLFILETVRRHYADEYTGIVTETYKEMRDGFMPLPKGPGLGTELRDEILHRDDAVIERVE